MPCRLHAALLFMTLVFTPPVRAEVDSFNVIKEAANDTYVELEGLLTGRAPGGPYRVRAILRYPIDGGSKVGLLEILNASNLVDGHAEESEPILLNWLGDAFIRKEGVTYLGIDYLKSGTEASADPTDFISEGSDGYQIALDARDFLRGLDERLTDPEVQKPHPVDYVVAGGISRSGGFLRGFFDVNVDRPLAFDGWLIGLIGGSHHVLVDEPPYEDYSWDPSQALIPAGVKAVIVNTEYEVTVYRAPTVRSAGGIVYEIAGTTHVPGLAPRLLPHSNPVSNAPAMRGAVHNLIEWVSNDVQPPPAAFIDVSPPRSYAVLPGLTIPAYYETVKDSLGNARGGVRLPHVAAPIGIYSGIEVCPQPFSAATCDVIASGLGSTGLLGGHFIPFDQELLDRLYPTHGSYVEAVADAARQALDNRWIVQSDYDAYVEDAAKSDIGGDIGR